MPKYEITTRYKAFDDNDQSYYAGLKKTERERMLKRYPTATDIKQSVITDGVPDMLSLGELRGNGQVAIRTEFMYEEAQA
jgi:hypothetical protein